jgi:hypothetical protein
MTGVVSARPWRSVGVWMAVAITVLMAVNTARAALDPIGFANYFGLVGAADAHAGFVHVYALRTLFLALVTGALIVTGQWRALAWFAACAVVMPVGDAALVASADGPTAVIARHCAIAAYLAATAWLLFRLHRATA